MADEEEEKEYRWETGYEKTWYSYFLEYFNELLYTIIIYK